MKPLFALSNRPHRVIPTALVCNASPTPRLALLGIVITLPALVPVAAQTQPLPPAAPVATRLEPPREDSDVRLRKHLLGEWIELLDEPSLTVMEFKDDGTFVSSSWDGPAKKKKLHTFTGNWTVADGFIVYETKTCSDPSIDISQSIIKDKVTSVSPNKVTYRASDGASLTLVRGGPEGPRRVAETNAIKAIYARDMAAIQRSLDSGASVDARDDESGLTLLIIAIKKHNLEAAKLLLEKGANVDARTENFGKTALFFAANTGDLDGITMLLKHGAQVDATDNEGNSALREAILGGNPNALSAFLRAGCDIYHKNKFGQSMWDIAQKYGSNRIKAVLNKSGR